jgi:hypothetical protein
LSPARIPGYWMNETSGVLAPAVIAYLEDAPMTLDHIAAMRAYFRQWLTGNWRGGEELEQLRARIDEIATRADIREWLDDALDLGIDPL